ncbi:hypothetical protein CDL24_11265 [Mediterraneibacter gnavus]|nr:hypothetical protein CDL24_11265 [Mediterraneibacter gnavus]
MKTYNRGKCHKHAIDTPFLYMILYMIRNYKNALSNWDYQHIHRDSVFFLWINAPKRDGKEDEL